MVCAMFRRKSSSMSLRSNSIPERLWSAFYLTAAVQLFVVYSWHLRCSECWISSARTVKFLRFASNAGTRGVMAMLLVLTFSVQ